MVIKIVVFNGFELKQVVYRGVIKPQKIAEFREGFYAMRTTNKCGMMWELKGKSAKLLAKFGNTTEITELRGLED